MTNAETQGHRFKQSKVCLASHPEQVRLHFMKLFALFMVITEAGRGHVLVEVKVGKFLLNYFPVKISVKNLERNLLWM